MFDLDRFKNAQHAEFGSALAELRAGRKRTHWIWFVFPQLRGLGSSSLARLYGLDGAAEAEAYLRDDLLRERLAQAIDAVYRAVCEQDARIEKLMGSQIDALKLISSLTLFEHVGGALVGGPRPAALESNAAAQVSDLVEKAAAILDGAQSQGYPPCRFTLERLSRAT